MITGKNYIGSELIANGSNHFATFSPKQNSFNTWKFIEATDDEVLLSTEKAWNAFKQFRKTSPEKRALFLDEIANEIEILGEKLIDVYMLESGLPMERAIAERKRTLFQLRSFATFLREDLSVFRFGATANELLNKKHLPIGPVVVFGASNFPLAYSTAGGDTASALAAGCPVIVKSHPMHAGTGEMVASAVIKAAIATGMPDGVFSNLNAADHHVGVTLVKHKYVKAIGFTGSLKGGRAIFDLANQRNEPIPVFAEMGSVNPIVISSKSMRNKLAFWVDKIGDSMFQSAGQFCTSPGLILAVNSLELDNFSQKLADKIEKNNPELMLGPSIKTSFSSQKSKMIGQEGTSILTTQPTDNLLFSEPTILEIDGNSFLKNTTLHEEVFGTFAIVVKCKDLNELEDIIDNLEGQLTGTIITESDELVNYFKIVEALQYRVGRLIFNGVPTGVEVSQQMHHGGPYPASTDARFTAVGSDAIFRWLRPVCYQNFEKDFNL